jgi:hypothetical protein
MPSFVVDRLSINLNLLKPSCQDPRMVEFAIEGYFGQAARFSSFQRFSVRVVSGDLSVYPLYDPLSFYLND